MAKSPLFKVKNSDYWYVNLTDPKTGKRVRFTTGKKDYEEAMKVYQVECAKLTGCTSEITLRGTISLYCDPATNPRYQQSRIDGRSYSAEYAKQVAGYSKYLLQLLNEKAPRILDMRMFDILKINVKQVRELIVADRGRTRGAQIAFRTFKVYFSQACEDCVIQNNPCTGLRDIHYDEVPRESYPEEYLREMIAHTELWADEEHWAYFTLLATTGMRRSEALALNKEQLYGNTLTIDRALKSNKGEIGLPKWNIIRVIPLSKISMTALSYLHPDIKGNYFTHCRVWVEDVFYSAKTVAHILFPNNKRLQKISAHTLRHSLHSNLLANRASEVLAGEYLSWNHQKLSDIQQRYTHIYAEKLQCIADLIDEIYVPHKELKKKLIV